MVSERTSEGQEKPLRKRYYDEMDTDERPAEGEPAKRQNQGETDDVSSLPSTMRFLVSNSSAGGVIGKGGVTINEFQQQSGAKIVLSRAREFFPGTSDRIILLSGTVSAILTALHLILTKISEESERESRREDESRRDGNRDRSLDLKVVVPNKVCGAIIGKGGATIKSFIDDSGAIIKLSSQDPSAPAASERLITVGGTLDQQLRAVALILTKMSEDPAYVQYSNVPLSQTASGGSSYAYSSSAAAPLSVTPGSSYLPGPPPRGRGGPSMQGAPATTTIIVAVPDEHIGAVVGKGGRSLHEIQQTSGVRMTLSDRGDFVQGTNNRKVTITGTAEGVVAAQQMIARKVQQSMEGPRDGGGYGGRDEGDRGDRDRGRDDRGRRDRDDTGRRDRDRDDRRRDERDQRW